MLDLQDQQTSTHGCHSPECIQQHAWCFSQNSQLAAIQNYNVNPKVHDNKYMWTNSVLTLFI